MQNKFIWERFTDGQGNWSDNYYESLRSEIIADLKKGIGKEPGAIPSLWPYYTKLYKNYSELKKLSSEFIVEHYCLSLYGLHQQSKSEPMHYKNHSLGRAFAELSNTESFRDNKEVIKKRLYATLTATSLDELSNHIGRAINLFRSQTQPIRLDYKQLYFDLLKWQSGYEGKRDVIRRWGMDFYSRNNEI
jgi:CRISPR system Cascade subunit CasB